MERGGAYLMVSFLAGTLLSASIRPFGTLNISQYPLFIAIFLLIICYAVFYRRTSSNYPAKSPHLLFILSTTTLFLLGFTNNQRQYITPQISVAAELDENENKLSGLIERVPAAARKKIATAIGNYIPNLPDRAVITALAVGEKDDIPHHLKEAYRSSGAAHLLALSGMHAAVIYSIICCSLFIFNISYRTRRYKFLLSILIIFLFTYITGFSASVQRAAIMITVWKGVGIYNRSATRWSAWLISACIILLINPAQLHNIGFQLSFAAVAGIIALYPTIRNSLSIWSGCKCYRFIKPIWDLAGISIACQIATAPLVWYYFNTAPTYFLITNLAAVPLSTIAIYSLAITAITSPIPVIGTISALFLQRVTWLLNYIIEYIGKIS